MADAPMGGVKAADVVRLLAARHPKPAWAFLEQVANGTGVRRYRWADAVAMSLYPSRGLGLHGFEVKVARSDWARELANPDKAEEVAAYCDYWWIVAGSDGVVKDDELPSGWGLMVVRDGALHVVAQAPRQDARPVDRPFLAALVRRLYAAAAPEAEIERIRAEVYSEAYRQGQKDAGRDIEREAALRAAIKDFERRSGVRIDEYDAGRIGDAVKQVLWNRQPDALGRLQDLASAARKIADDIEGEVRSLTPDAA